MQLLRNGNSLPRVDEIRAELVRKVAAHARQEGENPTPVPWFRLYRRSEPLACTSTTYEPGLVIFAQGRKRVHIGETTYTCDESTFLLTTIDLPVVSQIMEASAENPQLALLFQLDLSVVRKLLSEEEFRLTHSSSGTRGMAVGTTSREMLDASLRLVNLLDSPRDIPFLSRLLQQEILYRLLHTPQGQNLRAIATLGEQSNRVAKAVYWLRANYDQPLRIEHLAEIAQMGISTLHHHFRQMTGMSPLQYQKRLRLHVARERMLHDGLDAARAAFEVGYESPSQFSREYSRFFGLPPMREVKTRRLEFIGAAGN